MNDGDKIDCVPALGSKKGNQNKGNIVTPLPHPPDRKVTQ